MYEFQVRTVDLPDNPRYWVGSFGLLRYNMILLGGAALAGYRNLCNPDLASAFTFNGVMVGWVFTVAFPWLAYVW